MESGCEGYQKAVFCESHQWLTLYPSFYQLDTKLKRFNLFFVIIRTSGGRREAQPQRIPVIDSGVICYPRDDLRRDSSDFLPLEDLGPRPVALAHRDTHERTPHTHSVSLAQQR